MSLTNRREAGVGKTDLHIEVGAPVYTSSTSSEQNKKAEVPTPEPIFEERLAVEVPWVIDAKPKDSWITHSIWWMYTRARLYKFEWIPQPRTVLSYAKAVKELKRQANELTASHDATGQIKVGALKGGVGKTSTSGLLGAGIVNATNVHSVLIDTDLAGATALSAFAIDPAVLGSGMTPLDFIEIASNANRPTYRQLMKLPNRPYKDPVSGLAIIGDDSSRVKPDVDAFSAAIEYASTLWYAVVADTPPGYDHTATLGVTRHTTVELRIGRYEQEIALKRLESMRKDDEHDQDDDQSAKSLTRGLPRMKLRSRHNTPLVIVNNVPMRKCNTRTQHEFAKRFATVPDHVLMIPVIKGLDKSPIDIESYDAHTQYLIYNLVLRTLQKLAEINLYQAQRQHASQTIEGQPSLRENGQ